MYMLCQDWWNSGPTFLVSKEVAVSFNYGVLLSIEKEMVAKVFSFWQNWWSYVAEVGAESCATCFLKMVWFVILEDIGI